MRLRSIFKRFAAFDAAILLLLGIIIPVMMPAPANAANIMTSRSLSLSSSAVGTIAGGTAGEGGNGQKAKHTVSFTFGTNNAVNGSILVMYCTSPVPQSTCTTPGGLTSANITAVTVGGTISSPGGYTLDTSNTNTTINTAIGALGTCNGTGGSTTRVNCVPLKRGSGATESGKPTVTVAYGGGSSDYITNPDATNTLCLSSSNNCPFYARVFVFSDTGYTNANLVDYGGVAASTAQQITITAKVPERLEFSVGVGTGGPPLSPPAPSTTCAPLTDNGALALGDTNGVLSTSTTYDAYSYFRVNSNATVGTNIYYSGDTLKNGANSITQIGSTATASATGTPQFGLALDQARTLSGSGYSFTSLSKTAPYDTGHGTITSGGTALFAYEASSLTAPKQVAGSSGSISCDTGAVRYIANVATNTPAGIYTTTITFIATSTY